MELFGKGDERQNKIRWYESTGLCPDCYKLKIREQEKKQGLLFNFSLLPLIDDETGENIVYVWFSGDTLSYKEKIKNLHKYSWEYRHSANDMLSISCLLYTSMEPKSPRLTL